MKDISYRRNKLRLYERNDKKIEYCMERDG